MNDKIIFSRNLTERGAIITGLGLLLVGPALVLILTWKAALPFGFGWLRFAVAAIILLCIILIVWYSKRKDTWLQIVQRGEGGTFVQRKRKNEPVKEAEKVSHLHAIYYKWKHRGQYQNSLRTVEGITLVLALYNPEQQLILTLEGMAETDGVPPQGFLPGKRAAWQKQIRRKNWIETREVKDVYLQLKTDAGVQPLTSPQS